MEKNRILFQVMVIFCLAFQGVIFSITPAAARTETVLSVRPALTSVLLGDQIVLELAVTDGSNVNAFDVKLAYDQTTILLNQWTHGGYLSSLSCLHQVNQPGLLELACTQIAQPPVSGDGILLRLVFDSLAVGSAPLEISGAIFADPQGVKTYSGCVGSVVEVRALPTLTPTLTVTPTVTATSTATPARKNTQEPTAVFSATFWPAQPLTSTATPSATSTKPAANPSLTMTQIQSTIEQTPEQVSNTTVDESLSPPLQIAEAAENPAVTPGPMALDNQEEALMNAPQASGRWLAVLLWIALIGGLVMLVVIGALIFRRRADHSNQEDTLL
jgi:hypothetical protein